MSSTRTNNSAHAKTRTDDKFEKTGIEALRANGMMAHLLQSLEAKQDIGHYGRLVFAMIARHFLNEDELLSKLCMNPGFDEMQAKALLRQVESRDYNPPRPERIREWQAERNFPATPIIALSAHAIRELVQASLDAGCTAHDSRLERSA